MLRLYSTLLFAFRFDFQFVDIDDIDFQTSTSTLSARWSGFEHPHEDIHFIICICNTTDRDVMVCADGDSTNTHTFNKADLIPYQVRSQLGNLVCRHCVNDSHTIWERYYIRHISKSTLCRKETRIWHNKCFISNCFA